MKRQLLTASLAGMALCVTDVAYAQWLGPHLDAQRWNNVRKHQQKQRAQAAERHKAENRAATANARPLTLAERQTAWSRNKAEYRQRVARDGQASADRWLDSVALANR